MLFCKYVQARGSSSLKKIHLKKKVNAFQVEGLLDHVTWPAKYNLNFTWVTLNNFPEIIQDTRYCEIYSISSCTLPFQTLVLLLVKS